jgi:uncharacterized protein YbjT (DUF2867 family)
MILVAGGTGTLGTRVVRALSDAPVRVLTRSSDRASHLSAEIVVGDVREPATLPPALHGVTTVISAVQGFAGTDPGGATAVDLRGNSNLLRAAVTAGAQRFILISAVGAAPDSALDLRRVKHQAEQAVLRSGLETLVIRPTVYLETWLGILSSMIETKRAVTLFGRGANPINFVSADDVAALVDHATRAPELAGATLEIGGPDNLTLNELARTLLTRHGLPEKINHVPLPVLRAVATLARPFKPSVAALAQFGITMDVTDMTLAEDTARARVPGLPLTSVADVVALSPQRQQGGRSM